MFILPLCFYIYRYKRIYIRVPTHFPTYFTGALVGLVAESLDGLQVIQAFDRQAHFLREAAARTDANHRAVFACESLNLWLAFWCDCYGAVMVLAVACFAVAQRGELGANAVGLAFSNTIQARRGAGIFFLKCQGGVLAVW